MIRNDFFPDQKPLCLKEICDTLLIDVPEGADINQVFSGVNTLSDAKESDISVLHNARYIKDAHQTQAGLCLTTDAFAHHVGPHSIVLCHPAPYRAYAKIATLMFQKQDIQESSIHPSAVIDPSAKLGKNCVIGSHVVIGKNVIIDDGATIDAGTVIHDHVKIGKQAKIASHVTISHCIIGDHVLIKPGTCIGQQGFGFHMDDKGHFDVPQLGIVEIGHNVQIGSNVCIDRGSLTNTVICDGVHIDNLVQIAHNVYIGAMSVIVAQVGIAGSTRLGRFVILAGQAGLAGHLTIGDHVKVAAQSGLMRNVESGQTVAGSPAISAHDWHKQTILLQRMIKDYHHKKDHKNH